MKLGPKIATGAIFLGSLALGNYFLGNSIRSAYDNFGSNLHETSHDSVNHIRQRNPELLNAEIGRSYCGFDHTPYANKLRRDDMRTKKKNLEELAQCKSYAPILPLLAMPLGFYLATRRKKKANK
ncbi:hypothetical protein HN681_05195 [archaeon]|nr:hypothetical protein [archaeon]